MIFLNLDINKKKENRVLIVGVNITQNSIRNKKIIKIEEKMKELKELVYAAGAVVEGEIIQNKKTIDPVYYIGRGKAEEIKEYAQKLDINLIVFSEELSGIQIRNLEDLIGIDIIDRTTLILDIFAQRALSKEGKLQVELAQLKYRMPRLLGIGEKLSKTGAGIGARGPGEKKLEIDKRHILRRIDDIKREIVEMRKIRQTQRNQRKKNNIPIVALVGYTNAGKSTLLNELIKSHKDYCKEKEVLSKDMLFATLDVTLRKAMLPCQKEFLVTDTVGFVSDLPHYLVEAFKSTLEEIKYADLIIHVVDASNEHYDLQMNTTKQVLKELEVLDKDTITVFNKVDKIDSRNIKELNDNNFFISCKTGENLENLVQKIEINFLKNIYNVEMMIPFDKSNIFDYLKRNTPVETFEYTEKGILLKTILQDIDYNKYQEFIISE